MNEWIVMLELYIKDNKSEMIEKVQIEMKRDELAKFVGTLSKLQEEVQGYVVN